MHCKFYSHRSFVQRSQKFYACVRAAFYGLQMVQIRYMIRNLTLALMKLVFLVLRELSVAIIESILMHLVSKTFAYILFDP